MRVVVVVTVAAHRVGGRGCVVLDRPSVVRRRVVLRREHMLAYMLVRVTVRECDRPRAEAGGEGEHEGAEAGDGRPGHADKITRRGAAAPSSGIPGLRPGRGSLPEATRCETTRQSSAIVDAVRVSGIVAYTSSDAAMQAVTYQ